ncbi:hypothetical protein O0L34_g9608 [Tuta absoluta]|nr:hypothetical protein O0L34_g9608 [Tuta absoluta]
MMLCKFLLFLSAVLYAHTLNSTQKIKLEVYYETLCPDCKRFFKTELVPLMKQMHEHIDLRMFPYGKVRKSYDQNRTLVVKCQHGPDECYGNKLHACAIDLLQTAADNPDWFSFIGCLMANHSNDAAADLCAKELNIDPEPIKACAKVDRGSQLFSHYGKLSSKVPYTFVPYVVIDGNPMGRHRKLISAVCDHALDHTVCTEFYEKVYTIMRLIFFS